MILDATLDGTGLYGTLIHFAFSAAFFGSAVLIFLYLWKKGRLDMDEEPAARMVNDDDEKEEISDGRDKKK